ncbi:MAG: hypothetical protein KKG59_05840 [Nanoarchaeota archaeon]|nr:hypothetical protein [Nanoarchaeota archaeon]
MVIKFKQKCHRCKKNYVLATRRSRFLMCWDCQKGDLQGEIKDPKFKRLLNIPEEFYRENAFLRDIKIGYLRWGKLSDKQIEAFRKSVKKMKEEKAKPVEK